jgi:hypothetical protein
MKLITQLLVTAFLSAAAGMIVGLPLILHENASLVENLLKSGIAGCAIGIVAFLTVSVIFRTIHSHPLLAFLSVAIIIAFGTLLGGYLSGVTEILHYIAVISGGEFIGIILTILLYRYTEKLNTSLKSAKEKYRPK